MDMTLRQRQPVKDLVFHSDRGCQYTSLAFRRRLEMADSQQSRSRSGCGYDHAAGESFFHSLKVEWLHGHDLRDLETVRTEVSHDIKGYYHRSHQHSTLGTFSPSSSNVAARWPPSSESSDASTGGSEARVDGCRAAIRPPVR